MELVFLVVLIALMVFALTSGFPVAFALPGSAILSIGLAALCGWLFAGDPSAYFAQDGPIQWLSAGVTNFRSLYWDVERDTLIAIPLFVFMGIMLQRSRIAEDLLVAMAQLFGPIPGGLGISVVFVGALLAATTGIVGATVIAMGMISLPAMLRNNYSKPLATGTICASGTLGQIIPPSIVLIILADQLSNATDQASTVRKAEFTAATGEFTMPSEFDITSASAGDMFMGAFLPGLVLVALYMAYILVAALIRPRIAPPVPYDGKYDAGFAWRVLVALVPPLTLIFVVLGSILLGIATVNQAGAIGAIGSMIMAGYRLTAGRRGAYSPAVLAVASVAVLIVLLSLFELNVKNIRNTGDALRIAIATIAVVGLLIAVLWSAWRTYRLENTLAEVMVETAKTTSMVFIILIGAAMLTSAFRGFGGEDLVKEFLTGLPGGFWSQFVVVMLVIFLLGFFLDFIEIAVVVVPIVAPILLADPSANITAVWLGVMVGLNIQTSFLTPPFGFALFYLRGVAPPSVQTLQIYRGAVAFIVLQLVGLGIAGVWPSLVNYLPYRIYLTSETAPPPMNPRLQHCLEAQLFPYYERHWDELSRRIDEARQLDDRHLPPDRRDALRQSLAAATATRELIGQIRAAEASLEEYVKGYRSLHREVREIQSQIRSLDAEIEDAKKELSRITRSAEASESELDAFRLQIESRQREKESLTVSIPGRWKPARERYLELAKAAKLARLAYRRNADESYEVIAELRREMDQMAALAALTEPIDRLEPSIETAPAESVMQEIKAVEAALGELDGVSAIKSSLAKARRKLNGEQPDREGALGFFGEARESHREELAWRENASGELVAGIERYEEAIRDSIGIRLQSRLSVEQAKEVASCQAHHRDVSLSF